MKEITKTRTIYVAYDGKEFFTKELCEAYEKVTLEERVKAIKKKEITIPYLEWGTEIDTYVAHINKIEELIDIASYEMSQNAWCDNYIDEKASQYTYPCDVVIFSSQGWVDCDLATTVSEKLVKTCASLAIF